MAELKQKTKSLLSDFCSLEGDKHSRLTEAERLTLVGGDDLSKLFRRIEKAPLGLSFTQIFDSLDRKKITEAHDFYIKKLSSQADFKNQDIFKIPTGIIAPKIIPVHGLSDDGEIVDIEFESCYQSLHPSYELIQNTIPENKTVRVRFWRHHQSHRPTIVCVHGWTMNDSRVNALAFLPGMYFKMGYDVVMFELPFHGRRLNSDFRDAGHTLYPSANLILTNEATLQAVSDLRQLKLVLRALGIRSVGALGISLGSYLTTLWASLDELKFSIGMLPFASFGNVAKFHAEKQETLITEEDLASLSSIFNLHSPVHLSSQTPSDRFLFVYSEDDSIIPFQEVSQLKSILKGAQLVKILGDHSVSTSRDQISIRISEFINKY